MLLDKNEILGEMQLQTERVPFGKGEVIVSELSASDYIALYTDDRCKTDGSVDMAKFVPMLVVKCVVDIDGNRIFNDDETEIIKKSSVTKFEKLAEAAKRLNGLGKDTNKEIKN